MEKLNDQELSGTLLILLSLHPCFAEIAHPLSPCATTTLSDCKELHAVISIRNQF